MNESAEDDWDCLSPKTRQRLRDLLGLWVDDSDLASVSLPEALQLARAGWDSQQREAQAERERLTRLAALDALTGCLNRDAFFRQLTAVWEQASMDDTPLACVMADVDQFKRVNDSAGHAAGDDVLRKVAMELSRPCVGDTGAAMSDALEPSLESVTLVGRYGGDEFCRLLGAVSQQQAMAWAQQVRAVLERELSHTTVSLGVATMAPDPCSDPSLLVELADQALYEAKAAGRNCVQAARSGP